LVRSGQFLGQRLIAQGSYFRAISSSHRRERPGPPLLAFEAFDDRIDHEERFAKVSILDFHF